MPEISIIIPTKNRQKLLFNAINSVVEQTFKDWELIIINDTENIFLLDQNDKRISIINNKFQKGANGARNTGLCLSKGQYITFLDDDDLWDKYKLEKQLKIMKKTGAVLSYTGKNIQYKKNNVIKEKFSYRDTKLPSHIALQLYNYVGTISSIMIRRDVLKNNLCFDENIYILQDYDFYLELAKHGSFQGIPEPLITYIFDYGIEHTSFKSKYLLSSTWRIFCKQKGIFRFSIIIGITVILCQKLYWFIQYKIN